MSVTLKEMKNYLRVDFAEDNKLIEMLITSAEHLCVDILRCELNNLYEIENGKAAVMYAVNYMYEHRTDADYHALMLSLRSLLHSSRNEAF